VISVSRGYESTTSAWLSHAAAIVFYELTREGSYLQNKLKNMVCIQKNSPLVVCRHSIIVHISTQANVLFLAHKIFMNINFMYCIDDPEGYFHVSNVGSKAALLSPRVMWFFKRSKLWRDVDFFVKKWVTNQKKNQKNTVGDWSIFEIFYYRLLSRKEWLSQEVFERKCPCSDSAAKPVFEVLDASLVFFFKFRSVYWGVTSARGVKHIKIERHTVWFF